MAFPDLKDGFVVNPNAMLVSGGTASTPAAWTADSSSSIAPRAAGLARPPACLRKNVTALAAGGGYLYVGTDNGLVRIAEGALR